MNLPDFKITMDGLWAGKVLLSVSVPQKQWSSMLGEEPRILPAHELAPDWRERWIYDKAGIHLLCDKSTRNILSVEFVWLSGVASYEPEKPFSGRFFLNGVSLNSETKPSNLPPDGPIGLVKSVAQRYGGAFGLFYVSLKFRKKPNQAGRRIGLPTLAYLDFCYSAAGMPENVVVNRLRKN